MIDLTRARMAVMFAIFATGLGTIAAVQGFWLLWAANCAIFAVNAGIAWTNYRRAGAL